MVPIHFEFQLAFQIVPLGFSTGQAYCPIKINDNGIQLLWNWWELGFLKSMGLTEFLSLL